MNRTRRVISPRTKRRAKADRALNQDAAFLHQGVDHPPLGDHFLEEQAPFQGVSKPLAVKACLTAGEVRNAISAFAASI